MLRAYVCHVIKMSTPLMLCPDAI
uniref:Uncharacterized protein n=1 Tax=Rhizophora mucronata TaxID=61149 RepID=A0A2P2NTX5_RHIMU